VCVCAGDLLGSMSYMHTLILYSARMCVYVCVCVCAGDLHT
jgi:hypothetical protein